MRRRPLVLLVGVVALLGVCGCVVFAVLTVGGGVATVFTLTRPVSDAGDAFLTALSERDFERAYGLSSRSLQAQWDGPAGLQQAIEGAGIVPAEWSFNSVNVTGNTAELSGPITYADGHSGTVSLSLVKGDSDWLVSAFALN